MPWCTLCRGTTVFQIECALVSFHNLDIVYKSLLCLQLESSFIENLSNKKTWAKWNCIDNSKLLKSIWTEIWQSYICLHITQDNSFCFNFSCFLSMARRDPAGGETHPKASHASGPGCKGIPWAWDRTATLRPPAHGGCGADGSGASGGESRRPSAKKDVSRGLPSIRVGTRQIFTGAGHIWRSPLTGLERHATHVLRPSLIRRGRRVGGMRQGGYMEGMKRERNTNRKLREK